MSSACDTLSPRPVAVTGPISTISADSFLGLDRDHRNGSNRASVDEFVDLENGNGEGPSVERNEASIVSEAGRYLTIRMECFEFSNQSIPASSYGTFWSKITTYWQRIAPQMKAHVYHPGIGCRTEDPSSFKEVRT